VSTEPATVYTAISFAPVQGFIEKSRKLRDLYGASLILSYLSQKIVEEAEKQVGKGSVISPGLIEHQEGMPNRILVKGELTREVVEKALLGEWQRILRICREWVEDNIDIPKDQYHWSQKPEQRGEEKGEWERWGCYAWEVFVGWGRPEADDPGKNLIQAAMDDLETRKLKRDWVAVNWVGESSSLSGTDAIACPRLGEKRNLKQELTQEEKQQFKEHLELFYYRLAWRLDNPDQKVLPPFPELEELKEREQKSKERGDDNFGKYVAPNERLSIPELVKRLVTYEAIAEEIGMNWLEKGFTEIARMPEKGMEKGRWTGWFMGDGDEIGKKLKSLAASNDDEKLQQFSTAMRNWGQGFKIPPNLGRVIYAGGDDFLGVLYSNKQQQPIEASEALKWLIELPNQWKDLHDNLQKNLDIKMSFSVGFIWAGHSVPQRDVLQHCREAEKRAKSLGRDRLTIRVLFNSGQYVQWTCPWAHLKILNRYQDRVGGKNWTHLYNDWAYLKSRHAIRLREVNNNQIERDLALVILDLYFDGLGKEIQTAKQKENQWKAIVGDNSDLAIVQWVNDLVQVGWQLCRNSNI
jgi:CRISPR-associated protein Cmr2